MRIKIIMLTIMFLMTTNIFAISTGIDGRAKGDVISVKNDDQIATWCDFNKQIVITAFSTLCIYNGKNGNH